MKALVHLIAGARPNFMKVSPLYHALMGESWCEPLFIHTGQHYDHEMSGVFLGEFKLPQPHHHLGVGAGSHAEQTAGIMLAYERVCSAQPPDWVIVVGDTNSTMACAVTAKKLCLPVAHMEAGLRSRDRTMPEEINRLVTDSIADLLWTPSPDADENLRKEGIPAAAIDRVGNIMIDTYEMLRECIEKATLPGAAAGLDRFGVVTLHRPSNVDDAAVLGRIVDALAAVARHTPLVFPVHPRTAARLAEHGLLGKLKTTGVQLLDPLGYVDFMALVRRAAFILTDSGGVQEETTYLKIQCLTLRKQTERPITLTEGSNRLIDIGGIESAVDDVRHGRHRCAGPPELWDGGTAARTMQSLRRRLESERRSA
jgi:UDP-N-acetylglucosamine 2-epimerase (non-hydrolysing)